MLPGKGRTMIKITGFENVEQAISLLAEELELSLLPEDLVIEIHRGTGIKVSLHEKTATLECKEKNQIFRALGLLMEQIKEGKNECEIEEEVHFDRCGVMFDLSRDAVLTVDTLKKLMRYMAVMGLDSAMLYMEDTYEVKEYPYFGYMRGRYSFEELKECDDYADLFGIELIPCIQTLGHMEATLRWDYAQDMLDTENVLLVGEEKTYEMIEHIIKAATAPFRSNRIHLGMDEAWGLGTGAYLRKNGYHDSFDIMTEHLNRVLGITRKLGLKSMIWSDMFFRLGSKTLNYYDKEYNFPEGLKDQIPSDLGLVYWDYYHKTEEEYEIYAQNHKELTDNILFAGGIWTWNGMGPKHSHTTITTNCGLSVCKKQGIKEVYATMWGDDGAEVNIMTALFGMQQYAEHNYHQSPDEEQIKKRFRFCAKEDPDAYIALSKLDEINLEDANDCYNPSKFILWQDILFGLFDGHFQNIDLKGYYKQLEQEYTEAGKRSKDFSLLYDFQAKLCAVLDVKWNLGIRMKKCYDEADKAGLKQILVSELLPLKEKIDVLCKAHRELWHSTNKPFGFEVIDIRYGGVMARIDTAVYRLEQYLNGELKNLEELEQERLPYSTVYSLPGGIWHRQIASASPWIGR